LPWLKVSCGTKKMILRGSNMGGIFWLVFASALLIIATYPYFKKRDKIHHARYVFMSGAIIALGIIIYKYIAVALNPDIPFYIPSKMIGFELKIGAFGTIVGLILALLGGYLMDAKTPKKNSREDLD
jgi:hypothetical protein